MLAATPGGGTVSITSGSIDGDTWQAAGSGVCPASAAEHTPNEYAPGVAVNARASSVPNPSCPATATVNVQPDATVPRSAVGTVIVICRLAGLPLTLAIVPPEAPSAVCHCARPKPSTSIDWLQASAGVIV